MANIWAFLCGVLLLLPAPQGQAKWIAAADLGTSFSPHGIGMAIGYECPRWCSLHLGTGLSKRARAGYPVSLSARLNHSLHESLRAYILVGSTHYFGRNRRTTIRFDHHQASRGFSTESNASWDMNYARVAMGLEIPARWEGWRYFGDVGFAAMTHSSLEAKPVGTYDDTNATNPVGIDTGGAYDYRSMGPGDFGFYVRCGVAYVFGG